MSLPNDRLQHFLRFQPEKRSAIRIGTFGDSHTYGNEMRKTNTYPYQLQKLFDEYYPGKKVEVLNFGMSGHGFQEQFFLWEEYAKAYQLDYILIGPRGFQPNKDLTFRKNWPLHKLIPPKERFILSEGKLKLVQIKGNSLKKRYKNYYSLLPLWVAFRYDKNPFQIWENLLPFLRNNFSNPFYYKKIFEEESSKINKLLLRRMQTAHNKKILFFTDYTSTFNRYKSEKELYNLNLIQFKRSNFYKVFYHESSLGNEIVAKIYFNALTGSKEFSMNIINCYFEPHRKNFSQGQLLKMRIRKFSLSDVKSIQINTEKKQLSSLRRNSSDHY